MSSRVRAHSAQRRIGWAPRADSRTFARQGLLGVWKLPKPVASKEHLTNHLVKSSDPNTRESTVMVTAAANPTETLFRCRLTRLTWNLFMFHAPSDMCRILRILHIHRKSLSLDNRDRRKKTSLQLPRSDRIRIVDPLVAANISNFPLLQALILSALFPCLRLTWQFPPTPTVELIWHDMLMRKTHLFHLVAFHASHVFSHVSLRVWSRIKDLRSGCHRPTRLALHFM